LAISSSFSSSSTGDRVRRCFLFVAWGAIVLAVIPAALRTPEEVTAWWHQGRTAQKEDATELIRRSSFVSTEQLEAIRRELNGAKVVMYVPLPCPPWNENSVFEQRERLRNLLYPEPRQVHLVASEREARSEFGSGPTAPVVVIDYSRSGRPPSVEGFELLYSEGPVRVWRGGPSCSSSR